MPRSNMTKLNGKLKRLLILCFVLLCGIPAISRAQTTQTLDLDDPELYVSLFRFVEAMDAYGKSDPRQSGFMQAALCRELNISQADLGIVLKAAKQADLVVWEGGENHHPMKAEARSTAVRTLVTQLSASLTPRGWLNLHKFINGSFRQASTKLQFGAGTAAKEVK
jgi:hypothetical protein